MMNLREKRSDDGKTEKSAADQIRECLEQHAGEEFILQIPLIATVESEVKKHG